MSPLARPRERGFILIVVLVFAVLLASILGGVLQMSSSYLFSAAAYSDAARADELGRTAASLVVQRILSSDSDAPPGGTFIVRLPDAEITVNYLSEAARIDVNASQPDLLVALFQATGVAPEEAKEIGEHIKTWANQQNAPGGGKPHIENISQIISAWDVPPEVFARVRPYLTVSNPSGKVDPIIADKRIIEAIFGGDTPDAETFLRQRKQGFEGEPDALMSIPLGARGYVGFGSPAAFHARVRVQLSNRVARRYELVVVPPKKTGDHAKVTSWESL